MASRLHAQKRRTFARPSHAARQRELGHNPCACGAPSVVSILTLTWGVWRYKAFCAPCARIDSATPPYARQEPPEPKPRERRSGVRAW